MSPWSWNLLVYHVPHHAEAVGLREQWNGLWKTQCQHQLDGNALWGWGRALQEMVYALNQCLIHGPFSPTARVQGSRNQGVEMGVVPLTIIPSD